MTDHTDTALRGLFHDTFDKLQATEPVADARAAKASHRRTVRPAALALAGVLALGGAVGAGAAGQGLVTMLYFDVSSSEPVDTYTMYNSGDGILQYQDENGEWHTLTLVEDVEPEEIVIQYETPQR